MADTSYPSYWANYQGKQGQGLKRRQDLRKFAQLDKDNLGEIVLSGAPTRWATDPTYTFVTNPELLVAGPRDMVNQFLSVVGVNPGSVQLLDGNVYNTPEGRAFYEQLVTVQRQAESARKAKSQSKPTYSPEQWLAFSEALKGKEKEQWVVVQSKSGSSTTRTGGRSRATSLADKIDEINRKNAQATTGEKMKVLDVTKLVTAGDKKGTGARTIALPSRSSSKKGAYDQSGNQLVAVVSANKATFDAAMDMLAEQTGNSQYLELKPYYGMMPIPTVSL